jgi:hypothetical protein
MKTAVEWFLENLRNLIKESELTDMRPNEFDAREMKLLEQAKEMEKYKAKVEAKKYYLKGFEDAELTESQNCPHEQTMKDAETHFELVYPIKTE